MIVFRCDAAWHNIAYFPQKESQALIVDQVCHIGVSQAGGLELTVRETRGSEYLLGYSSNIYLGGPISPDIGEQFPVLLIIIQPTTSVFLVLAVSIPRCMRLRLLIW